MKRVLAVFGIILCWATIVVAQCGGEKAATQENAASAKTAASGDAKLYFVLLNRPANAPQYSKEKGAEIQDGHMANIRRLYGEGKLEMAGPFMDDTTLRGIFVFKASSVDDVKAWLATDPAVKAGRLEGDVHPWTPAKGAIHHVDGDTGMENYAMLIYRWTEKGKSAPQAEMQKAFEGHKKYQLGLYESAKTDIGGPFADAMGGPFIGVVIAHTSKEEGEKLAANDPVVQAGIATVDVHPWITAKGVLGK
jgi:uncharacterized protein